jgi:hypothetical protein
LRNLSELKKSGKPLWCDINIAWGNAPGNPSYARVEYTNLGAKALTTNLGAKAPTTNLGAKALAILKKGTNWTV